MIKRFKKFLKKLIPGQILKRLLPAYHLGRAYLAGFLFGYPAKKLKVIAVTGTNGKTTTAAYIASVLEAAGYKVGVSSTAFYKIGDKVTVNDTNMTVTDPFKVNWLLRKMRFAKVEWVVLEVTSHALHQNRIRGIPIVAAVMTNLTQDHLDYHGSMEEYAAAKGKLFEGKPELIVLNRDDEWFDFFDQYPARREKVYFGTHETADCQIVQAKLSSKGSKFKVVLDKTHEWKVESNLVGKFNVYNAAAAIATTYGLRIAKPAILEGVKKVESVAGRMESIDKGQKFSVIIDYAHTPDALENALETLKSLTANRLMLVFGATGDRDKNKRPKMGKVAAKHADRIFVTDEEPYSERPSTIRKAILRGIRDGRGISKTEEVPERRAAIKKAFTIARSGDSVIITGMGHQDYMTIASGKIPWNDGRVAREVLDELGKSAKK